MSDHATLDEFGSETDSEKQQKSSNWVRQSITEISEWTDAGGTPRTSNDAYWGGDISWVQTGELTKRHISSTEKNITKLGLKESTAKRFPSGTLLIGMYGEPTVGESALLETEATTNQACCGIFPDTDVVNAEFLHQMMQYEKPRLYSLRAGSGQQNIRQETIRKFEIGIPPLSEQRKIATVLHTVDQAIQKTEEIIEQVETIQMGIVQGLFETEPLVDEKDRMPSKGVQMESILDSRREKWIEAEKERQQRRGDFNGSIDESKYSQPLDVATRRLPELPDGWFWASLDTFVGYNIDYRGKTPPYSDSGVPVISSGNIQNGEIVFDDEKYVSRDTYDGWLDRGVPKEGDLLITTEAPVGKVALYPEGTYLPTRRIITLRTVGIENRYLKAAIRHPYIQNYLTAQSGGSTVGRILKDHLLRTPIPLPPKSKQRQISDTLKTVDNRLVTKSAHKSHLSRLKQGLMQDLLSGKVRTTDANIDIPEEVAKYG